MSRFFAGFATWRAIGYDERGFLLGVSGRMSERVEDNNQEESHGSKNVLGSDTALDNGSESPLGKRRHC
jgi:hypothetical protein